MRYILALFCPPVALLVCKKWFQAIPAALLMGLAIGIGLDGLGALIEFFLVLWAFRIVGDDNARHDARNFIRTVEPIPVIYS